MLSGAILGGIFASPPVSSILAAIRAVTLPTSMGGKGCLLIVSEGYLPKSDVKLTYIEPQFDGWLYSIEEMNLKGLLPGQKAWICPYLKYFFTNPPTSLFVKIEGLDHGI